MDNDDILFHILSFLNTNDLLRCSSVNKQFYNVVMHNYLWKPLCKKELFNAHPIEYQMSYYETYKLYYRLTNLTLQFRTSYLLPYQLYLQTDLCVMNKLYEIPSYISVLTNLEKLNLSSNDLMALPISMRSLTNLRNLDLSCNYHFDFHSIILNIPHLTRLSFNNNHMTEIPSTISKLQNLVKLELRHTVKESKPCYIRSFPLTIPIRIGKIPDSICQITNLQELQIDNNDLEILPENITRLTNLTCLTFSFNNIKYLPENIGNLTKLEILYFGRNMIRSLPDSFTKLVNLTWFQPSFYDIPQINKDISQMPWIKTVFTP